jgi:signal transduction histidine kinase
MRVVAGAATMMITRSHRAASISESELHISGISAYGAGVARVRCSRLSLRSTVQLLMGALFLLLLAIGVGTMVVRDRVDAALMHLTNAAEPAQTTIALLTKATVDEQRDVQQFMSTGDPSALRDDADDRAEAARDRAMLADQLGDDPAIRPELARVDQALIVWRTRSADPQISARQHGQVAELPTETTSRQNFDSLQWWLGDCRARIDHGTAVEAARARREQATANWLATGSMVGALGIVAATMIVLRRSLTRPLDSLITRVGRVTRGDLDQRVASAGPPELTAVATAVDTMRGRILDHTRQAVRDQQQFARYEEAHRIAEGLRDRVIRHLLAIGLSMQALAARHPTMAPALTGMIEDIDSVVRDVRTVVTDVGPTEVTGPGVSAQVLDVVTDSERTLGFSPRLTFAGNIDAAVPTRVADELVPAVAEALNIVTGHGHPTRVEVRLALADQVLSLHVSTDDPGIATQADQDGALSSIRRRAERLGGTCTLSTIPSISSTIHWRVPTGPSTQE